METKLKQQGLGPLVKPLGRIKILVAKRNKLSYYKAVGAAVAVGLVNLFLGAINMTALLYSFYSNDRHAVLCSVAFHFFSAEAIMGLSPFNGWSASLNMHHRTFVHVFLQLCALICACIGATMILFEKGLIVSVHAVSSIVTLSLALLCLGTGPGALLTPRYFSIPHVLFGIPTMVVASISFISGLFMPRFDMYFNPSVKYILLAFVLYSTVVITAIALRRFISWL